MGNIDAPFITETQPGDDFAASFEKSYGVSLTQFLTEADDYFTKTLAGLN